ncbi:hypothetical protein D9756_009763 [Leucocoprinus leucothites]|uniref:Yeast cell wall synthesis Kre9/Knh1-like N-terminal domain-containing protein n=1 Tax=Leucocoprinus leucothites TaxID=201217 RepID=A0A8H5CWR4_9AGAR|nr:hypothetical protein D9756_009763 [Leucoagaricus leucothites]
MLPVVNFFLTLLAFEYFLCVQAGLWIVDPKQGSVCHGGEPCTVTWLDDGSHPLLSEIGVITAGLYTGNQKLVQTIKPVDVSREHSLIFTPMPAAGPNSDTYYISFISTSAQQNNSLPYAAFSPFFRLDKMTGSFESPNPTAILPIPIPSSINTSNKPTTSDDVLSTITIGTISSSSTSRLSSTTTTSTGSPSSPTTTSASGSTIQASSSSPSSTTSTPISSLNSVPSLGPSGLTTTVLPTFTLSSASLSSGAAVSGSTSPSSTLGSSNTSGALSAGLTRGAGISIALASVAGLFLVL